MRSFVAGSFLELAAEYFVLASGQLSLLDIQSELAANRLRLASGSMPGPEEIWAAWDGCRPWVEDYRSFKNVVFVYSNMQFYLTQKLSLFFFTT